MSTSLQWGGLCASQWSEGTQPSWGVGGWSACCDDRPDPYASRLTSHKDSSVHVYYRHYARGPVGSKHLMVAVKILEHDAFVITAFFTGEVKGGKQVWPKE